MPHVLDISAADEAIRPFADLLPTGIAIFDGNGGCTYANPCVAELLGVEQHELLGRGWWDAVRPEDLALVSEAWETARVSRTSYERQLRFSAESGDRWVLIRVTPSPDGNWLVVMEDRTDVVLAQRAAAEARFRSAFEDAPIGIAIGGLDGLLESANPAMTTLLGYSAEEFAAMRWSDLTHPDQVADGQVNYGRLVSGEVASLRVERCYIHKNGEPVDAELSVSLVRDSDGAPLHFIGQLFDLRERNRAQREADALKNEFFALVSHELRTPLTSIAGYLDMLIEGEDDGDPVLHDRFLRVARRNTLRLKRLVADLLFAAQIDAGELPLDHSSADLTSVCRDAVEAARPRAADLGVDLEADIVTAATIEGDGDRLAQAVDNLVSNALKFTPAGGRVTVRVVTTDDRYTIEVEDTGVGIEPEAQAQLFERFYRAPSASDIAGVGLGLTITKAIVAGHDGKISLDSEPGRGSTFRIELPRRRRIA